MRELKQRNPRHTAHLVATVRRVRWLRFLSMEALVADLSEGGLKLAFGRDVKATKGAKFWVEIPSLSDAEAPPLQLAVECSWYDEEKFFLGGQFETEDETELERLKHEIEALKQIGRTAT